MTNPLDITLPRPTTAGERWHWATVTQLAPLRIRLDGDSVPLLATPENLAGVLDVGARVWVQRYEQRVLVHAPLANPALAVVGELGNTNESKVTLRRVLGGAQFEYQFQAGISEQANVLVIRDGETHSIFRIGRNGQLAMQTYSVSGAASATRPLPFAMATGSVSISGTGTNQASAAVTFPSGRFTSAPIVYVAMATGTSSAAFMASTTTSSTSGVTIYVTRDPSAGNFGSTYQVRWLAIQLEV